MLHNRSLAVSHLKNEKFLPLPNAPPMLYLPVHYFSYYFCESDFGLLFQIPKHVSDSIVFVFLSDLFHLDIFKLKFMLLLMTRFPF